MAMLSKRWGRAGVAAAFATVLVIGGTAGSPASARHGDHGNGFTQRNLVSDIPGLAELTDANVVNPWGIAFGPVGANATPLWVNNNINPNSSCQDPTCIPTPEDLLTKITLYRGATSPTTKVEKVGLEVTASSPTGMVFNTTSDFVIDQGDGPVPARFLFNETFLDAAGVAPEGRITGWAPVPPPQPQHLSTTSTDARKDPGAPLGLALVPGKGDRGNRLLVVDGNDGTIDVYDAQFHQVTKPGLFVDPTIAGEGFAPYNVMFLKNRVYVAYADAEGGPGGAVSVFKANGKFQKRLATNHLDGPLQAPWGMAIAPEHWGKFGGRLLVGNVGDGTINVFNRRNGHFKGTLKDASGAPLVNAGLWGIAFGNGVIGTPNSLIFSAGIGNTPGDLENAYLHGLVGLIEPAAKEDADDD